MTNVKKTKKPKNTLRAVIVTVLAAILLNVSTPSRSYAFCCGMSVGCLCSTLGHSMLRGMIAGLANQTQTLLNDEFRRHRNWIINDYFNNYISPAIQRMTMQLTAVGMYQVMLAGALLDAKHQLETERLFNQLAAEAYKDYHPSMELCTMGTAARGLAAAERRAQANAIILGERSIDRQMGSQNVAASESANMDKMSRLRVFKQRHCDPMDNNRGLASICENTATASATVPTPSTINRDVDYVRVFGLGRTINANLTDNTIAGDDLDVQSMASYLYAHDLSTRFTESLVKNPKNHDEYIDWRSIIAKRSVAENSFNSIIGMKMQGSEDYAGNGRYIHAVFSQLGVDPGEARIMMGDSPSYYALMETLAQKIYQNPQFYTNLYDKPVNVARKDVAMQAIDLMLARDTYRSDLRYEALLGVLLETEIMQYQDSIQNRLNSMDEGGKKN